MITDLQLGTFSNVQTLILLVSILFLRNFILFQNLKCNCFVTLAGKQFLPKCTSSKYFPIERTSDLLGICKPLVALTKQVTIDLPWLLCLANNYFVVDEPAVPRNAVHCYAQLAFTGLLQVHVADIPEFFDLAYASLLFPLHLPVPLLWPPSRP